MQQNPLLVLKIGTAAITTAEGEIDEGILEDICRQVAVLHQTHRIIIVSSGAVGCGKKFLPKFSRKLIELKAAAAIGNPILMQKFAHFLNKKNVQVAQMLCERKNFSERDTFIRLRKTCEECWKNSIIPICNENDVIADFELKFSDNDQLATLIATGFSAKKLLLGTSVEGLLDGNKCIAKIKHFNDDIFSLVHTDTSEGGLGGMLSKLTYAKLASNLGTDVHIFNVKKPDNILKTLEQKSGTYCPAAQCNISAHQKWLASGSLSSGKVYVDTGAINALKSKKSLLCVGIKSKEGSWNKGEILEIYNQDNGEIFGVGKSKISAKEFDKITDPHGIELIHTDEIIAI